MVSGNAKIEHSGVGFATSYPLPLVQVSLPMSHTIESILFATDFSECAKHAQEHATFWASTLGARLHVVHVIEFPPGMDPEQPVNKMYLDRLRDEADGKLRDTIAEVERGGATAQGRLETGIASQALAETAEVLGSGIVVMGTKGLTGLDHLLIGSTAERLVRLAPCPVLTVRTTQEAQPTVKKAPHPARMQRVLAPLDFSDCSLDALEFAIFVAKTFDAALTIQHVLAPVAFGLDFTLRHVEERRQQRKQVESWLSDLASSLDSQGLRVTQVVTAGEAADSILGRSQEQRCDLIVMGTHGRRGISHLVSGSVAEGVLRKATCPVLTVKSPKFAIAHRAVLADLRTRLPVVIPSQ